MLTLKPVIVAPQGDHLIPLLPTTMRFYPNAIHETVAGQTTTGVSIIAENY